MNASDDTPAASVTFAATVEATGGNTTGIRVPDAVVRELGRGKRARVEAELGDGYRYRTTFGSHDGATFLSISAAVREAAGVAAGDELEVRLTPDDAPREVTVPEELEAAFVGAPEARAFFATLTDSQRRGFVDSVTSARTPETRDRRVTKAVTALAEGRKRP